MTSAPQIDGTIEEQEWQSAVRNVGLVSHATGNMAAREAVFWVGCDGQKLYVAVKSEPPPDGQILTRAVPDDTRDQLAAFLDDSIELVIDPKRSRTSGDRTYYHIITNARGALYDWAVDPDDRQNPKNLAWRLRDWQLAQRVNDGWWEVEIAIPLARLGATPDDLKGAWGLHVARNWRRPAEQSQWAGGRTDYDDPTAMPVIRWDASAPVVRVMSLHQNWSQARIEVAVFNPHAQPITVDAFLADAWHRDPPREQRERLTVPPQQEKTVVLESRDGGREGLHQTTIRVTAPDGIATFYERQFTWSLHRDENRWLIGEEQKQAVDLAFKFYPSYDKIRFRANIDALSLRDRVTGAEARILQADEQGQPQGTPLWRHAVTFEKYVAEGIHSVPDLPAGRYVFALQLQGGEGVPGEPVVQPFVRSVFPWEGNSLGVSVEVMPPFTPLQVQDKTVSAVLRQHVHGTSGLWDAVTSDGQSLLAGPMQWEVAADAVGQAFQPGNLWRATAQKPTQVAGEATWSAGPVKAHVATQYDYDGMMLATLTLEPTATPVDRVSLAIPLRDSRARYMHSIGDGLRHNFAGFTPAGQGRIWDSSRASKLEIIGTFFPYLWLGDGERGLCWFADTDRDWVLDETTPTIDLTRQADTLWMRVHFITRPTVLRRQHRIVFGLQATPTKPMPDGWRRWMALKTIADARPVRWVGATYYWGGTSFDVYPYKYRFDFYDKLREARETGTADRRFVADWMSMVERELAAKGTDQYKFFEAHVNAGFHSASSSSWRDGVRLFGYTNPRGIGFQVPEFETFQDEWLRYGWFNRNWGRGEGVGYDVSPSRSFQDYALWYYREMLRCFDGVYWDNLFLSANFDPVVGDAWADEQGRVHPTMGLMHLRELAKRTAVMLWQESKNLPDARRPPITLSHMTNTMIVPVHGFVNCTMDWEWKYGYEDFQDRFSADSTVAESIGRQVGAWPTILAGGHPDPKDPRVDFMYRTRLGVALVHEIQVFDYQPRLDAEIYQKLFQFGYGTEGCRVYNYWQDNHPVKADGIDARTLAMTIRGAAIVVVTDYGNGGAGRVSLDWQRLGLRPESEATDLETAQPIQRVAPGVFHVELRKHDFCILHIR
jgi:hypothetical protein